MECPVCGSGRDYQLLYNCQQCGRSYCKEHLIDHPHAQNPQTEGFGTISLDQFAHAMQEQMRTQMQNFEPSDEQYEAFLRENPKILTTGRESLDLLLGIALIAWVFGFADLFNGRAHWQYIVMLTIIISPAFILHELAHKYAAIHYGKYARFALVKNMAFFTFIAGLLGIPIAGPGATMILGRSTERESGIFSAVGPLTNFLISAISYLFYLVLPDTGVITGTGYTLPSILLLSMFINAVLGLFNMLPFGAFDGRKILNWNGLVWFVIVLLNLPMLYIGSSIAIA